LPSYLPRADRPATGRETLFLPQQTAGQLSHPLKLRPAAVPAHASVAATAAIK